MNYQNLPAEFVTRMKSLLGDEWEDFSASLLSHKYQALRWNVRKARLTAEEQKKILEAVGIHHPDPVPWAENGWYYTEEAQPGKHPYHEMGMYYIQEPSAMSAAALLHPLPGERVLDLCGAPGGKSTQLAAYMEGQGLLIANEINPARCRILSQNIERMGIANAIVTNEDSGALAARFPAYFHRIQVDAPCSGEGMFRKNPEAIQEWSLAHVKMCADRQLEILENAGAMLMPGGRIVYSTCTFAPEENEQLLARFLTANPDFTLEAREVSGLDSARPEWIYEGQARSEKPYDIGEECIGSISRAFRLWPHHLRGEGHFAAILRKKGEADPVTCVNAGNGQKNHSQPGKSRSERNKPGARSGSCNMDAGQKAALEEFLEETLEAEVRRWILDGALTLFGDQLYRLPEGAPSLEKLRVLRPGLHIGAFKKNRFEPSHALALYLSKEQVKNAWDMSLSDERVAAYFRGETLEIGGGSETKGIRTAEHTEEQVERQAAEHREIVQKGWCLVCVNGYSAGWGKAAGGQIKNHYPKGLRKYV